MSTARRPLPAPISKIDAPRSCSSTCAHWRATQAPNKADISGAVVKSPPLPILAAPAL